MRVTKRHVERPEPSLNYCAENPVQGSDNTHCFHDVDIHRARRDGMRMVGQRCCWCKQYVEERRFVEHGPHAPEKPPKEPRRRPRK